MLVLFQPLTMKPVSAHLELKAYLALAPKWKNGIA